MPERLKTIKVRAFVGCTALTTVTFSSNVSGGIEEQAFAQCTSLSTINWPPVYIRHNTFMDCTGLAEFTIPEGATGIDSDAFTRCTNLAIVRISSTVGSIWGRAFIGCENLADVYYYRDRLPDHCGYDVFDDTYINLATLHVPASAIEDFRTTKPWSEFGHIVAIE